MIRFKLDKNGLKPFNRNWWKLSREQWAPVLLEENKPYWAAQTDTEGRPWVKLDEDTPDTDGFILKETGEMFNSAVVRPWGRKFLVDSTFYGVIHQFGTRKVPARPWMGVPESSLIRLSNIAVKNILTN